jgi:Succinylglutamate desuccinylase / Aspartoacylase family
MALIREASLPGDANAFLEGLAGPALLRLPGRDRGRVRVVSGTLHGNEPSGVRAIHQALRTVVPAVDVLFFIGAVAAARAEPRFSHRMLPGRRDLNRCFRAPFDGEDGALAEAVLAELRAARPEAVVDLHNNSGHNPAYAIGTVADGARLALGALFAERYVCSSVRLGTFVEAFEDVCPAVTIECGRAGDIAADAVAFAGLERFLRLEQLDTVVVSNERLSVFTDAVRVTLRPGLTVAFAEAPDPAADLTLDAEIDRHNFETLPAGTRIGWVRPDIWALAALDAGGVDRSRSLFAVEGGERAGALTIRQTFTPIMMTTDPDAAVGDCLFYAVHQRE